MSTRSKRSSTASTPKATARSPTTTSELQHILTRLGESCTVEDCVKMIKSVDSDGDGCVDFDEFKKMMMASGGGSNSEGALDGVSSVAV
ncbi:putative EF-hand domain pair protein CML [Helianthus annuus]|uniref:EF-hand domain pair protein CML n=1 Tax=Helianthus annuus TaxID=4232 RepID=A0A251TNN2_HELAN|nr:putative EF-hand domain pair protein CML [Helianthus annuus]KAJ0881231.1 putative EF-hand domain pair protein CML [Helianthus annuus]